MCASNIFANIPQKLSEELFENIISTENVKIERIVSCGHTSPKAGWYNSTRNEWVILLEGAAVLTFDDGTLIELFPGDYINIVAHTKHKVSWTKPDSKTIWLAIYY